MAQASIQGPSVYPLASCCHDDSFSVILGCLVTGFFPEPVNVKWDTSTLDSSVVTFPATTHQSSGLYTTVSLVNISSNWDQQELNCSVVHEPSNETVSQTVTACSKNVTVPTVRLFHTACEPGSDSQAIIQLLCLIAGITSEKVRVTWLVNGKETQGNHMITAKDEGKLASTYSELNITQDQWVSEKTYTCRVTIHGKHYHSSVQRCLDCEPRGVITYLIPPSPIDLYIKKTPKLTCLVVDLASSEMTKVKWSRRRGTPVNADTTIVEKQLNATFTATSTLPVDTMNWVEGESYRCIVSHPDLPRNIEKSITKIPGKRLAPQIYLFGPPKEQKDKDRLTLTCLIQNFFPPDISVQWLQNQTPVFSNQVYTTESLPTNVSKSAFFTISLLEISKSDWEQQNNFICQVVHEALDESKILEKSVSIASELDLQDLCIEEDDSKELDELWLSTYIFITLFLLSVSYSATVTLLKVQWVFSATLQGKLQDSHEYTNIL